MATTKPLTIWVHPDLALTAWVADLSDKGHDVRCNTKMEDIWDADLILGPNCARFLPGMEQFLESFIKGARAICYKTAKEILIRD